MPRQPRLVIPGLAHHVTQRGAGGKQIFFADEDRSLYLEILRKHCVRRSLSLVGYCLMTNHVHIVGRPAEQSSLRDAVGRAHWQFAIVMNKRLGQRGHFWQERFYSCPMDEDHLVNAMRYVERNPCRAGLATSPWSYPWSSSAAHCGQTPEGPDVLDEDWRSYYDEREWRVVVQLEVDDLTRGRIREATLAGKRLASLSVPGTVPGT